MAKDSNAPVYHIMINNQNLTDKKLDRVIVDNAPNE